MLMSITASKFPWVAIGFAVLGTLLLVAGAHFGQDLYGRDLIVAAIALATVAKKEEK